MSKCTYDWRDLLVDAGHLPGLFRENVQLLMKKCSTVNKRINFQIVRKAPNLV